MSCSDARRLILSIGGRAAAAILLALALSVGTRPARAEDLRIKMAILPPEGTTWGQFVKETADQIGKDTQGRIKITLFAGGTMGDEPDVVRKLRLGQVQAAGLTGMGLGMIASEIRVIELPLLLKEYKEAVFLSDKMFGTFRDLLAKKGMVLLTLGPFGGIYIFTQKPLHKLSDIAGEKAWVWAGDPLAEAIYKELAVVTPVPLPVIEVLTALQTGLVNSFYINPLGAIAFQWYPYAKYIVDTPLTMATSGFVVDQKTWDKVKPEDRAFINQRAQELMVRLGEQVERENEKALLGLKKKGVQFTKMDPQGQEEMMAKMETVHQKLVGVLYPKPLLEQVQASLKGYRSGKP
ncbi:MAG: TRAP transporter substrate-binding protein DctP [Nitrospirae bacterium]|nr:TRAP transporter substrate-binding protein DctP [Nitrospirota bacterium]